MAICISMPVLGCSPRSPLLSPLSQEERIRKDRILELELSQQFESDLKFWKDEEVTRYLEQLAHNLVNGCSEIEGDSVKVSLIQNAKAKWTNFGLPGNRLYLSVGLLKSLKYENEVAAAIAIQLAHIQRKHVLKHVVVALRKSNKKGPEETSESDTTPEAKLSLDSLSNNSVEYLSSLDFFGDGSAFDYSEEEEDEAIHTAAKILYRAGYDVRGMVALLLLCQDNLEKCPYNGQVIRRLVETTYREIASSAPLRNPIVRSRSFLHIQKRIQRL